MSSLIIADALFLAISIFIFKKVVNWKEDASLGSILMIAISCTSFAIFSLIFVLLITS